MRPLMICISLMPFIQQFQYRLRKRIWEKPCPEVKKGAETRIASPRRRAGMRWDRMPRDLPEKKKRVI